MSVNNLQVVDILQDDTGGKKGQNEVHREDTEEMVEKEKVVEEEGELKEERKVLIQVTNFLSQQKEKKKKSEQNTCRKSFF